MKIIYSIVLLIFAVSCSTPMRVLYLDVKDDQGHRVERITAKDAEKKKSTFYLQSMGFADMSKDTLKFFIPKKEKVILELYEFGNSTRTSGLRYVYEPQLLTVLSTDTLISVVMKCSDAYIQDQHTIENLLQASRVVRGCVKNESGKVAWARIEVENIPLSFVNYHFMVQTNYNGEFKINLPWNYSTLRISYLGYEDEIVNVESDDDYIDVTLKQESQLSD